MPLLAELKRRNVIRMAGLYLVGAWLVVQVASTILPMFGAPAWLPRSVVMLLAIGFVPALVFAWVFELTPTGLKRDAEVPAEESIGHHTARRMERMIIAVLVVALGYMGFDKLVLTPALQAGHAAQAAARPPPATAQSTQASIAVMPFLDLSPAKDQEYFSDGISEELLNVLAKVPQLRVIARTSCFSFKGKEATIAEIARTLNVANVLEGSVRKSGNTVRVTVQLIRASDSTHLWSETYDRPIDDIFKVQDEIAAIVVEKLKLTLLGAAPTVRPVDPRAYPLILQANALADLNSPEGYTQALALYKQAVAIAPGEVRAWAGMGRIYINQAGYELTEAEGRRLAQEALGKAYAIDPTDGLTNIRLGYLAEYFDGDLAGAVRYYQQALDHDPTNLGVLGNAAALLGHINRLDEAISIHAYRALHDPLSPSPFGDLAAEHYYAGHWDQAIASGRKALALSPNYYGMHNYIASSLLLGKHDAVGALREMQSSDPKAAPPLAMQALTAHALGHEAEAEAATAKLIVASAASSPLSIAGVMAYRGQNDAAFAWLDQAVAAEDLNLATAAVDPMLRRLHGDPRWLPFLRKIGKAPEQLARIKFKVTLPH